MNTDTTHKTALPSRLPRPSVVATALFCLASCAVSFWAGGRLASRNMEKRITAEGQRKFQEFLGIGIDLGFVTVDRQKLEEIIITASEAEWEDRDAEAWGEHPE